MKKIIFLILTLNLGIYYGNSQTAFSINSLPSITSSNYTLFENTEYSINLSVFIDSKATLNGFKTSLDGNHELIWDLTSFNKNEWVNLKHNFTTSGQLVNPVFKIEILDDKNSGTGFGTFYVDDINIYDRSTLSISKVNKPVKLYPNPVKENLILNNVLPDTKITIFNMLGAQVQANIYYKNNRLTIPMVHLPQGIYLVKMTNSNGAFTKKVIKQ